MDDLSTLNDRQLEAVRATEGYVRVIAGAGSGKTRLLVSRYAYLVCEAGIDAANILCVTFTNKAAGEMKKRIRTMIGAENDTGLICTYHGFCARLLREDGGRLFLQKRFEIMDAARQKKILEDIYRRMELKLDHASFESILKKIGRFKSDIGYVAAMINPAPCAILPDTSSVDHRIMEDFMQRQKALYMLDFHDLISYTLYLLERNTEVREKWQEHLNYIMVDEFQDSSCREMRLVDLLSGGYGNVMVVGDPDQNIYEWRGSDVRLLVDFDQTHASTRTVLLNRNYRSTPQILTCANTLIDKNDIRIKKDLFTLSPPGAPVIHYHAKSDAAEAGQIVACIKQIQKETACSFSDFAVLYRSGFLSRVVEKSLTENGIPYEIFGGVRFWQRMEVQDVMAYLRLVDHGDDEAFRRVVNVPRRRMGRSKVAAVESWRDADQPGAGLFDTLALHADDPVFRGSGAVDFVTLITDLRKQAPQMRLSDLVRRVCEASGYEQYIRELGDEERLDNLAEFKRLADEFEKSYGEDLTLSDFLTQAALQSGEDREGPRDAVKLMTIHAAKGLEFPVVFLVGLTEGIFPSSKTVEERKKAGLEEERRLCYVAITRARERLFLMDSEGFSENGIKKLPSRFLREIGEQNYTRIGDISDELADESRQYEIKSTRSFARPEDKVAGAAVEHHIFGRGVILSRDDRRGSYVVKFDSLDKPRHIARAYFDKPHGEQPFQAVSAVADSGSKPPAAAEPIPHVLAPAKPDMIGPIADCPLTRTQTVPPPEAGQGAVGSMDGLPGVDILPAGDPAPPPILKSQGIETDGLTEEERQALRNRLAMSENLWKRDDVPKSGWTCTGVTDLGKPVGVCGMCGDQIIRYVHHMTHPHYHPLDVGCVCAGKMEGNIAAARQRERNFRNRQARQNTFLGRTWKTSKNGHQYLKVQGHLVLLYHVPGGREWKYAIDQVFCPRMYRTREDAVLGAFEELETLRKG